MESNKNYGSKCFFLVRNHCSDAERSQSFSTQTIRGNSIRKSESCSFHLVDINNSLSQLEELLIVYPFKVTTRVFALQMRVFIPIALVLLCQIGSVLSESSSIRGRESFRSKQKDTKVDEGSCFGDHPDRMTSFPGWNQPLPSAWYSGCELCDVM